MWCETVEKLEEGMAAYHSGDYDRAILVLGPLVEEDPTQVEAKLWLGASLVAKGEPDRAIFLFKRVHKEAQTPEIRQYAIQMLVQLGVMEAPPETEEPIIPLRPLQKREVSFHNLMREICLLDDVDLGVITPWFEKYIADPQVFSQELAPGFAGSEACAVILEGLLSFDSPRRQGESKSRLQSFVRAPERVREQILGVYVRSVDPGPELEKMEKEKKERKY